MDEYFDDERLGLFLPAGLAYLERQHRESNTIRQECRWREVVIRSLPELRPLRPLRQLGQLEQQLLQIQR
jgi:hypothetical protein